VREIDGDGERGRGIEGDGGREQEGWGQKEKREKRRATTSEVPFIGICIRHRPALSSCTCNWHVTDVEDM
jgi:hypothetical protein